jgi:hypothetical protein
MMDETDCGAFGTYQRCWQNLSFSYYIFSLVKYIHAFLNVNII